MIKFDIIHIEINTIFLGSFWCNMWCFFFLLFPYYVLSNNEAKLNDFKSDFSSPTYINKMSVCGVLMKMNESTFKYISSSAKNHQYSIMFICHTENESKQTD